MRKDMAKVIVERPRRGGGRTYREHRVKLNRELDYALRTGDDDGLYTHESMRHWASYDLGWDRKELNENLNPLRRFLRSCVGRKFSEVYAEICEHMDVRSACQYHIWQHARDYIETNTFIGDDGEVWYNPDYPYYRYRGKDGLFYRMCCAEPIKDSLSVVYVDPRDGTVQLTPKIQRYRRKPIEYPYRVEISDTLQAHWIFGAWYLVEIAEVPQYEWKPWSEEQKVRYNDILASESNTCCYRYGGELSEYRKSKDGRWIRMPFHDVALNDIMQTWRNIRRLPVRDWEWDNIRAKDIYGRENVYARRRWQMNKAELRKYRLKHVAGRADGLFA